MTSMIIPKNSNRKFNDLYIKKAENMKKYFRIEIV